MSSIVVVLLSSFLFSDLPHPTIQAAFHSGGGHDIGGSGAAKEPKTLRKGRLPFQSKVLWSSKGEETLTAIVPFLFFHYLSPETGPVARSM